MSWNDKNDLKPVYKLFIQKNFGSAKLPDEKPILKEIVKYSTGKLKHDDLVLDVSIIRIKQSATNLAGLTKWPFSNYLSEFRRRILVIIISTFSLVLIQCDYNFSHHAALMLVYLTKNLILTLN